MSRTLLRLGLGLVDDLAHQRLPRLRRRQTRYALKLDDLALVEVRQPSAFRVKFGLATIEGRLALLERGHLAIERLLPVEEAALGALEVGALLARLILGGAAQVNRLILALEDDLLLLRARLGNQALRILLGMLDRVARHELAREEPEQESDDGGDRRHDDDERFRHSGGSLTLEPSWA